jgi:hypothetical protein
MEALLPGPQHRKARPSWAGALRNGNGNLTNAGARALCLALGVD